MSWVKRVGRAAAMVALLIMALFGASDELGRYADDTNPYGRDEDK